MYKIAVTLLLLAISSFAQDQGPAATATSAKSNAQKAEIAGQVIDSATGQPLKKPGSRHDQSIVGATVPLP
jgi:hypothetical protein